MKQQFFILFLIFTSMGARAQETVFELFKNQVQLADEYYNEKKYHAAFQLYSKLYKKDSSSTVLPLQMARCAYQLKNYHTAARLFKKCPKLSLTADDYYYFAESQIADGHINEGILAYNECLKKRPLQPLISEKIWQLNNIQYLYEDSTHYVVRNISLNTTEGELCPVPFGHGILFISNRQRPELVEKKDAVLNTPFYHLYFADKSPDPVKSNLLHYKEPVVFSKDLYAGYHSGPLSFYDRQRKMVFASVGDQAGTNGKRTLRLFFAAEEKGKWKITGSFPYNSSSHSITDPSISEDGKVLYFSSNMRGGLGGKDIYRSFFKNGNWSRPENLGETINTPYDEVFPHLHQDKTLYFSSNGHPGMGGLDIFKSELTDKGFSEVQNVGYPINSRADEFGLIIDASNSHGYFSSNRKRGGYDDDLYEVDIDLQTYPLEIAGWMGFKEHSWADSSDVKTFAHAKFYLIDILKEVVVQEGVSDAQGNFTWIIPYFSKYRMRVVGPENDEHMVSLEIPKQKQLYGKHEIVIVKDAFRLN
jgi:tetratricopeptide (TPR) repeat protein